MKKTGLAPANRADRARQFFMKSLLESRVAARWIGENFLADPEVPFMLEEIRDQPELIKTLSRESWGTRMWQGAQLPKRVWLVGCGDMAFAGGILAALYRESHIPVGALRSMDLRYGDYIQSGDLVIAASISGRTHRTIEAAHLARKSGGFVVGLTDNPGTDLENAVDRCVVMGTHPAELLTQDEAYQGYRYTLAQTRSFLAVLFVLDQALGELTQGEGQAPDSSRARVWEEGLRASIADVEPTQERLSQFGRDGERIVCLGSGPFFESARYAAAKFTEFAISSWAQCLEEYNHLEMFLADEKTRIFVFALDELSESRAWELIPSWQRLGARVWVWCASHSEQGSHTQVRPDQEDCGLEVGRIDSTAWSAQHSTKAYSARIPLIQMLVAAQFSAMGVAMGLGRDVNQWLGGVRTDLIQQISQSTIRGSKIHGA